MEIKFSKFDEIKQLLELRGSRFQRNKHPKEQIERLAYIMRTHGVRQPIHISTQTGEVVFGHGRWEAAKLNGWKEFPIVYQNFKSLDEEYACVQSDNAIAAWSDLDLSAINKDLEHLGPDFDIDLLGIKDFELEPADKYADKDADEVPEVKESFVKRGELWKLGNHRLMCGDSTSETDVAALMNGEKANITFTSPPYNAAKDGYLNDQVAGFSKKYKNNEDAMSDDDFESFLANFTNICTKLSDYVFVNIQLLSRNKKSIINYQYHFRHILKDIFIWNKKICPPNIVKGAFNTKWEYILCLSKYSETRGFPCEWQGKYPNVVETESNSGNEFAKDHKAGFPVALPLWFLDKLEFVKSVLDPFGGTGTTIIACEKTNRKCFMMELDPHYCGVIIERWQQFTGQKAERIV